MKHLSSIKLYTYIVISVFFLSCQKEKISIREYPRIEISDKVNQGESGVNFNANIITEGNSAIIKKGFVWVVGNGTPYLTSSRIIIHDSPVIGKFEATSNIDFIKGVMYSVRAFVQVEGITVYSKKVQFESIYQSPPPELIDYTPKKAQVGDTIKIKGHNFSFVKDKIKVLFGTVSAKTHFYSDTAIYVKVPEQENTSDVKISVQVYENTVTFPDNFSYLQPEISELSPKKITNNNAITITGKDFLYNSSYCSVIVDNFESNNIANSTSIIKAIISIGDKYPEILIKKALGLTETSGEETPLLH